jgi:hypothetical protein
MKLPTGTNRSFFGSRDAVLQCRDHGILLNQEAAMVRDKAVRVF